MSFQTAELSLTVVRLVMVVFDTVHYKHPVVCEEKEREGGDTLHLLFL